MPTATPRDPAGRPAGARHGRRAGAAAGRPARPQGDAQRQRRPGRVQARLRRGAHAAVRHPDRRGAGRHRRRAWATRSWCERITGVALAKGETRSDWLRRPLSPSQLEYAADDVRHLDALHRRARRPTGRAGPPRMAGRGLRAHLAQRRRGRRRTLAAPVDAQRAVPRRRGASAACCACCAGATRYARDSDRPRSWILDNELATTLARTPPVDRRRACRRQLDAHPEGPAQAGRCDLGRAEHPAARRSRRPAAAQSSDRDKAALRKLQDAVAARSRRRNSACPTACSPRAAGWKRCSTAATGPAPWPAGAARNSKRASNRCWPPAANRTGRSDPQSPFRRMRILQAPAVGLAVAAEPPYTARLRGAVAQLGERRVRNAKVGSSILLRSTIPIQRAPAS